MKTLGYLHPGYDGIMFQSLDICNDQRSRDLKFDSSVYHIDLSHVCETLAESTMTRVAIDVRKRYLREPSLLSYDAAIEWEVIFWHSTQSPVVIRIAGILYSPDHWWSEFEAVLE